MERFTIYSRKTHYFDWAIFHSFAPNHQRVTFPYNPMNNHHIFPWCSYHFPTVFSYSPWTSKGNPSGMHCSVDESQVLALIVGQSADPDWLFGPSWSVDLWKFDVDISRVVWLYLPIPTNIYTYVFMIYIYIYMHIYIYIIIYIYTWLYIYIHIILNGDNDIYIYT